VATEERHAGEHAIVIADQFVEVLVAPLIPGIETQTSDFVQSRRTDDLDNKAIEALACISLLDLRKGSAIFPTCRKKRFPTSLFVTHELAPIMLSRILGGKAVAAVTIYLVAGLLTIIIVLVVWRGVLGYSKFRGVRLVRCSETAKPAAVEVDAKHAALSGVIGKLNLRLKSCSRWPERQGCEYECLAQIEAAPEDCLVRNILTRWYQGKSCVYCWKPLEQMEWAKHKPALMGPDHLTLEWNDIRAEALPEVLVAYLPVCWNCHIVGTFRRRYPHLVVDRPWRPGKSHRSS